MAFFDVRFYLVLVLFLGLLIAFSVKRVGIRSLLARLVEKFTMGLSVNYQPIVDLHSSKWGGAEALVRFRFFGKEVGPNKILFVCRVLGINKHLTRAICKRVAADYYSSLRICSGIYISINLTIDDLKDETFPGFVSELFKSYGLPEDRVVFEITEQYEIPFKDILPNVLYLQKLNFRIALDDFGAGYSGLQALERLPINIIKMDKCFFSQQERKFLNMQKYVWQMAKQMRIVFVAEGIETQFEHKIVGIQGIRYAQGWFYSKALSATEFTRNFLVKNF